MISTTKADMKNLTDAVERYLITEMSLPTSLEDLDEEYQQSPDVLYCRFIATPGTALSASTFEIAAMHKGASTVVSTLHPTLAGRFTETELKKAACPNPQKKLVKVKKKK